jgi:hypothetical protein
MRDFCTFPVRMCAGSEREGSTLNTIDHNVTNQQGAHNEGTTRPSCDQGMLYHNKNSFRHHTFNPCHFLLHNALQFMHIIFTP